MTDVLSPEFEVTQATLQTMIVGMIDTYNVLNIMRDVGLDPDTIKFAGGGDYAWMRRVGWSPNGVYNLFHGCDSIYHNPSHNQKKHW
ncbi:MAG: hypothetical protein KDA45_18075, partial [Planctomycetales bacterium]|nr:hypothetical protein [Planctomycetales bacterium]